MNREKINATGTETETETEDEIEIKNENVKKKKIKKSGTEIVATKNAVVRDQEVGVETDQSDERSGDLVMIMMMTRRTKIRKIKERK